MTARYRWAVTMALMGVVGLAAGLIFYVGWAIDQNNQRTCRLYYLIYQPTPDAPLPDPSDPKQRRAYEIRSEIGKVLKEYKCEFSR
jgi:hypothetical protein